MGSLAARYGARELRVFGSVARREEQAASDVDILVRFEPGRSLLDLCALGDELSDLVGRRVEVVTDGGTRVRPSLGANSQRLSLCEKRSGASR